MTKINPNPENIMTVEELFYGLMRKSPYSRVAVRYFKLKGIDQPNIGDLLEAYAEMAKVDHKVNKEGV